MEILSRKTVFNCPILKVEEREVEHDDRTLATHWVVMHVPNVEVVGLTRDGNIVFIQAKRGINAVESFELPGGKVFNYTPEPKDLEDQAREELETETGFNCGNNLHMLFKSDLMTDWLERSFYYFAAWDLEPGVAKLESGEILTTVIISINEVQERLQAKQFPDYIVRPLTEALQYFHERGLI